MTLYEDAHANLQKMLSKRFAELKIRLYKYYSNLKNKNFNGYYNFFATVNLITD